MSQVDKHLRALLEARAKAGLEWGESLEGVTKPGGTVKNISGTLCALNILMGAVTRYLRARGCTEESLDTPGFYGIKGEEKSGNG
jgi:hypothetical protein